MNLNQSKVVALVASHIIKADNTVDNEELKILYDFSNELNGIENDIIPILNGDTTTHPLEELLNDLQEFSEKEKVEAFTFFLRIIYSDGYYHDKEKEILNLIRKSVSISDNVFSLIEEKVSTEIDKYSFKESNWKDTFSKKYYGFLSSITLNGNKKFVQKHKDFLLGGPDFDEKIKDIAKMASSDLDFSQKRINTSTGRLIQLIQELEEQSEKIYKAKKQDIELKNFLNNIQTSIKEGAQKQLEENLEILNKKRRSIDYFSVAFLGRTKAGKSTLHSIITNDEDDDIGIGKLRTTRSNRTYTWENLRIIDTPGIGAPGGEIDTKIAESIIDEVDLICYVVTNDAIQDTEFKFLAKLKARNKPIIILLNVKEDIEKPKRLNLFLKNPKKWIERKDHKNIQGHIDRINEYLNKYYGNCYYRVYPVMLLAAKMSFKDEYVEHKKVLFDSSNIDSFLKGVKEAVFDNGHLRKSQNIIDGCNYELYTINNGLLSQLSIIEGITKRLKADLASFKNFLTKEKPEYKKRLYGLIDKTLNEMTIFAKDFAINNYTLNEKELGKQWEKDIGQRNFITGLDNSLKREFEKINDEIKDEIKELAENFSLHISNLNFRIESSSTFNTQKTFAIGGPVVGAIGTALLTFGLVSNPIGWTIIGIGVAAGLIQGIFTSKQKKIEKAQKKIEESILAQISEQEQIFKNEVANSLNDLVKGYLSSINNSYTFLIEGSSSICNILDIECSSLRSSAAQLNKAIVMRLFQQIKKLPFKHDIVELVTDETRILEIDRNFEQSTIDINTKIRFKRDELHKINDLMQSEISINTYE